MGEVRLEKPEWLKIRPSYDTDFSKIKQALRKRGLVTVCEEAHCPNMAECWHNEGTATFMVLGDTCTRGCKFCAIKTSANGNPVDPFEPQKIASAIREMGLDYAVITSVDRDDLVDGGADHFAQVVQRVKAEHPSGRVEILTGDFQGKFEDIKTVVDAKPDVFAHNIETIKRLHPKVRDLRAKYDQTMQVLRTVKEIDPEMITKSAIMVGLGETEEEVIETMKDLRAVGCDILTIGQYLRPKTKRLAVEEFVTPEQFSRYRKIGEELGFLYVASGPYVRSSYRAGEFFIKSLLQKKEQSKKEEN
ncbi:MAG: lipoyl synthase [Nanoarchaeota archaeon]|nr:lipoyl synthase [Nanoarchaeota archaeon]